MGGKGAPLHLVAPCLEVTGCESSSGPGQRKKFQAGAQGLGIWGAVDQGRGRRDLCIRNLQGPLHPWLSCNQVQLLGFETSLPARNVWAPVLIPHLAESWLPRCPSPYHEGGGWLHPLLCPSVVSCPFPGRSAPGGTVPQ